MKNSPNGTVEFLIERLFRLERLALADPKKWNLHLEITRQKLAIGPF